MPILGRSQPNPPVIGRSSLADDPVLTTPAPVVVAKPPVRRAGVVIVGRASLADAPVLVTPAPVIVTTGPRRAAPNWPIIGRSSLEDVASVSTATPAPVVVAKQGAQRLGVLIVSRSSLADDPILTTPSPVVVSRTSRPPATTLVIGRSSFVDTVLIPLTSLNGLPGVSGVITSAATVTGQIGG